MSDLPREAPAMSAEPTFKACCRPNPDLHFLAQTDREQSLECLAFQRQDGSHGARAFRLEGPPR